MQLNLTVATTTIAALALAASATSAQLTFNDDFTAGATLADNYTYFVLDNDFATAGNQNLPGGGTNTLSETGGAFNLTASGVDLTSSSGGAFNFTRLTRSESPDSAFDLTQPSSLTIDVANLDNLFFDAIQRPVVFGFGDTVPAINVQVQARFNGGMVQSIIDVLDSDGNMLAPRTTTVLNPNNNLLTLNLDDDSFSVDFGTATVIGDTLHNLTFDSANDGKPFFEARTVFGGDTANFLVQSFSGSGFAVIDDMRLPGDANGDGTVSILDFAILRANFGSNMGTFETGDFNEDGLVSILDFAILRANFGTSLTPAQLATVDAWYASVVPEPTTAALFALGGLAMLRRRRA